MTASALRDLLRYEGRQRRFARGERLFLQGFGPGKVVVVHEGSLRVTATTHDGDEVTLALCGEGEIIGGHSALTGAPVGAGVIAVEDGYATILTAERYLEILRSSPDLMLEEIRGLVEMLHRAEQRLVDIATDDIGPRVVRQLVRLCGDHEAPVTLPLTQTDLASMVGAARASVAPVLASLREGGTITTSRGQVTVLDLVALRSGW